MTESLQSESPLEVPPTPESRARVQVMGILNVTPDSFFDGGRFTGVDAAVAEAGRMNEAGAHWIDVGGESSRPGAAPVGIEEELRRVLPVIEGIASLGVKISVDTYRAGTACRALDAGASMVNDITGLRGDPEMAALVAERGCACVIMHMLGAPKTMQNDPIYGDVVDDICAFFEERLAALTSAGVDEDRIWLDPGFGFGKTPTHNLTLMRRLGSFRRFGRPLLIGTSNKSTIGSVLDLPPEDRLEGTAATVAIGVWNGADAVRVHDVRAMTRVVRMTEALLHGRY